MAVRVTYDGAGVGTAPEWQKWIEELMPQLLDAARPSEGHLTRVHWRLRMNPPASPDARRADAEAYARELLDMPADHVLPSTVARGAASTELYLVDDRAGLGWTEVPGPMFTDNVIWSFYRLHAAMLATVSREIIRGFGDAVPVEVGR